MSKYTIEIFGLLLKAMTAAPRTTKINLCLTCEFRHTLKSFSLFLFRPWQTRTHCCGHIVTDTLLPTHCCGHKCFPVCPHAQHLLRTQILCPDTKMFLILFSSILCPQQMFPSLRSPRNIMGNNVSATMCPRLPGPFVKTISRLIIEHRVNPDTIGCVWTGEFVFHLNMLVDREGFELWTVNGRL